MQRSSVLLPPPEGPMIAATSPRRTESDDAVEDAEVAVVLYEVADVDHGGRIAGEVAR